MTTMTTDEIRDWLDSTGRDRFWLAEQIGSTKGTVDQWFSKRGFPEYAVKIIERLQSDAGTTTDPDVALVTFTLAEFEEIDRARRLAGYLTRREFYRDAIIEKAREPDPAADVHPAPLSARVRYGTTPSLIPLSRVAEAEAATDAPATASAAP